MFIFSYVTVFLSVVFLGSAEAALQCDGCHGTLNDNRPLDTHAAPFRDHSSGGFQGNHRTHMGAGATPNTCAKCHSGSSVYTSSHRDGKLKLSSRINASSPSVLTTYTTTTAGLFSPHTSSWKQSATPLLGSCNNVNCHFEKATPAWGIPALANTTANCSVCHAAAPSDGHHPGKIINTRDKHGDYLGTTTNSCSYCHVDHAAEANKFAHATSAGKRSLIVRFNKYTYASNSYTGTITYPNYLPSQNPSRNGACANYCHSNAAGKAPNVALTWSDTRQSACYSCHGGTAADNTPANCVGFGRWSTVKNPDSGTLNNGVCFPYLSMTSNGHARLVSSRWIRKYACANCHADTVTELIDANGHIQDGALIQSKHVNGIKDVKMPNYWAIPGQPLPSYSPISTATGKAKTCYNVYCHSDGTNDALSYVKPFAWTEPKAECNACHGHPNGQCTSCHYNHTDGEGKTWSYIPNWPAGEEWKASIPMFRNEGPGRPRANSHPKHTQKDFTCNKCHAETTRNGMCSDCHDNLAALGGMTEVAHINADKHVNGKKDVSFLAPGANYDTFAKTCSGTGVGCHAGMADPMWGGSSSGVSSACMDCHGNPSGPDTDNFTYHADGSNTARISLQEWYSSGHGRITAKGSYKSGNPAANFTANACWYCHDSSVMHNMSSTNPFRLRQHQQFKNRFDKECSYCHMEGTDAECLRCHNNTGTLAPQLAQIYKNETTARWPDGTQVFRPAHNGLTTCFGSSAADNCHFVDRINAPKNDLRIHNEGSGFWTPEQNLDVKNQYVQMGVCLQCHDDNSNGKCGQCHAEGGQYALGFSVDNVKIVAVKAKATSAHFGYKHYKAFTNSSGWSKDPVTGKVKGTWKGGKFCWDCHDPHGDKNIFMVHDMVATRTDGKFGIPVAELRKPVIFSKKETGSDYITKNVNGPPFVGICNACHSSSSDHYRNDGSDSHNQTRACTVCHEHRFSDSHASGQSCNTAECHRAKPVPRHSGFGLPRDCTKCHAGPILSRMDVMTQFGSNSHHVQGVPISNKHCYECHWESTKSGIIDNQYHTGFNYKNYSTVTDDVVDLVIYGANGKRPTFYSSTSAITFLAKNVGTVKERTEAAKVTNHCLSCHSDQNNDATPFNDCRTPRQYAWDGQSVAARYSQQGVTSWGKYGTNGKSGVSKAFSAHGNAKANQGGWDDATGLDGAIPNTRNGSKNIECYDCHSSHGSKVVGTTTSYTTFNGTRNGGNLKETQAGKGGYSMSYKASQNAIPGSVNPYAAGAGQCFDCHMNQNAGSHTPDPPTPWGFGTFSSSRPIKGYKDGYKFGTRTDQSGFAANTFKLNASPMKARKTTIIGGHLKVSPAATYGTIQTPSEQINGLCTPCHDPHGISPTLGSKQAYAVPLLKGTWMTSPYKDDQPPPQPIARANGLGPIPTATGGSWGRNGYEKGHPNSSPLPGEPITKLYLDRNTFGVGKTISENDQTFAGLCLRCHNKEKLTDETAANKNYQNQNFRTVDRIHETVKGWGKNKEHAFTCSKCHQPHNSALPRLMQTNCLDYKHRVDRENGGVPWRADSQTGSAHNADEHRGYPEGDLNGRYVEATTACHATTPGNSGAWPDNQYWNDKTRWSTY